MTELCPWATYPSSLLPLRKTFPSYLTMTDRSAHVVIMRHVSESDNRDDRHSKFSHESRTQYILGGIGGIEQTRSRHVPPQTQHNGGGHDRRHLLLIYIRCALCNRLSLLTVRARFCNVIQNKRVAKCSLLKTYPRFLPRILEALEYGACETMQMAHRSCI